MILAIESSCDESALALFDPDRGLVREWVVSQMDLHAIYGGVVPDIASREHAKALPILLKEAFGACPPGDIDEVAVTAGPGLAACLALGLGMAKGLGVALGVPVVGVNHLRGHVFSPFIALHAKDPAAYDTAFASLLPHLGLVVSGGNTQLVELGVDRRVRVLAETVDDAAGEALDKGAKLLGLGYPGGPRVEKIAKGARRDAYAFPRAFPAPEDMRFSFSGLKTSLRYTIEKLDDAQLERALPDLCASYQEAVVDALVRKLDQVLASGHFASVGLSGGVSNNRRLRECVQETGRRRHVPVLLADPRHTGDNAGMIAFAAWTDRDGLLPERDDSLAFKASLPLA